MYQELIALLSSLLALLSGITPIQHAETPPSAIQTIVWEVPHYTATTTRDGALSLSARRSETDTYTCVIQASSTQHTRLFELAATSSVRTAKTQYLPPENTFAYHGHDTRTSLTLIDQQGASQTIVYSDQPEQTPPQTVTQLGEMMSSLIWENMRMALERACGTIPSIPHLID